MDDPAEADETFEYQSEKSPEPITVYVKNIRRPIPATGSLPGGSEIDGPAGLKASDLADRHDDLVRQVVTKMLEFALGRQLEYYDEPALRKVIEALRRDGFRFQTLLQEVVASYPFQYKQNPSAAHGGTTLMTLTRRRLLTGTLRASGASVCLPLLDVLEHPPPALAPRR